MTALCDNTMFLLEFLLNNKYVYLNREEFVLMTVIRNFKIHTMLLTDILDPNCLTLTLVQPWKLSLLNKFIKISSPSKKNKSISYSINSTTEISSWMPKDTECIPNTSFKWKNCLHNSEMPEPKSSIQKAKSP